MSLEHTKNIIIKFLASEEAEVLLIKGNWGTGKTYLWNQLLKEESKKQEFCRKKYSYVSLFGIADLQQLKNSIFEESISSELIEEGVSLSTLKRNTAAVFTNDQREWKIKRFWTTITDYAKGNLQHLEKIPVIKDYGPLFRSAAFQLVRSELICIDDIERKSEKLEFTEVLGLVSILKEQRDCKIVIILNDSDLDKKTQESLDKYREKVIDIELAFMPNSSEAVATYESGNNCIEKSLNENIENLGINNIRIINKIHKHWHQLTPILKGYHQGVSKQVSHSLIILAYCFYGNNEQVPELDFVKKWGSADQIWQDEEKIEEKEKPWRDFLQSHGYQVTDESDLHIAYYLENGYLDKEALISELDKLNSRLEQGSGRDEFYDVWDMYHNTFKDNSEEFINKLEIKFRENILYLSPSDLDSVVRMLRELKSDFDADKLITVYITAHSNNIKLLDLEHYAFMSRITDKKLIKKFEEKRLELNPQLSLREAVESISGRDSWSKKDEEILQNATVDELYNLFKEIEGDNLNNCVKACLEVGLFSNSTSDQKKIIRENAIEALEKIGSETKLNCLRVAKFGVKIHESNDSS